MTEIMPFSDVTESRRQVRADTDELGVLLPESVLSKPRACIYGKSPTVSNKTRMPPLQGRTLLEVSK